MNNTRLRILSVFGTRPEAIKMAPLIDLLRQAAHVDCRVCVTAQHREMLDQALRIFRIEADDDLDLMRDGQDLGYITAAVLSGLDEVIRRHAPDRVLVQGDTTTTFAAALAAFYAGVPVAHVEAGLRTGDVQAPWPEEMNRRLTTQLADLHFAPTDVSRRNLLAEGVSDDRIEITGNTVIDALLQTRSMIEQDPALGRELDARFDFIAPDRRIIVATGHRRESFEGGLERVFKALARLAGRGDVEIVFPMHLNPNVRRQANAVLHAVPHVHLIEPLDYLPFVYLMNRASLIVTDSGGLQEEAPSLGKPVLVTRDTTERPEAVAAGTVEVVGTDETLLHERATHLLDDPEHYRRMSERANPYGNGTASKRILERLTREHLR